MKKLFPERNHTSILTYIPRAITISIFYYLLSTTTVYAACSPSSGSCTGSYCSVNSTTYCCTGTNTAAQCTKLKTSMGASLVTNGQGGVTASRPQECNGGKGIDTALGCLSVETEGFTASLLGFLAGISGAIALIIMLIATVQIMTGGDNAEQVKKGKELFTGAVTGLLFIIFSVTLIKIIAGDIIKLPGFQ
ncbi:MAG: hypothetical protein ABII21_03970 [bacterium]